MYKTNVEVRRVVKVDITTEMNSQRDNVNIHIRDVVDDYIAKEAAIDISPEGFIDLVYPILKEIGYRLSPGPEGF